jgi:hypothetical protein
MGIEPTSEAWEASILPLYDARSISSQIYHRPLRAAIRRSSRRSLNSATPTISRKLLGRRGPFELLGGTSRDSIRTVYYQNIIDVSYLFCYKVV